MHIPLDPIDWPNSWKRVEYKSYPNAEKEYFLESEITHALSAELWTDIVKKRRSFVASTQTLGASVSPSQLSFIMNMCFSENSTIRRRNYPSAGERYPLECYLRIQNISGIVPGVYHYNVKKHSLESILLEQTRGSSVDNLFLYSWAKDATVCIFLSAVFDRTKRKYGERGYRYILLEAGHVGQLVYEACTHEGLCVTALGGIRDTECEKVLGLDGELESIVHAIAFG